MVSCKDNSNHGRGRCPHGQRGLKFYRRAYASARMGLSPHGLRGLKLSKSAFTPKGISSRSPHGLRGLKCLAARTDYDVRPVAALMGCVD